MTATANLQDQEHIKDSLGLKSFKSVVGNPDRKNIYYEKYFRHGQEIDAVEGILYPIAKGLLKDKTDYPLTVIYIPLKSGAAEAPQKWGGTYRKGHLSFDCYCIFI